MSVHLMPRSIYWATDVNPSLPGVSGDAARPPGLTCEWRYTDAMDAATFPDRADSSTRWFASTWSSTCRTTWRLCEISETRSSDGGRAVILVPCGPGLYGTLDEVLGHFRRYTEKQLARRSGASRIPRRADAEIQSTGSSGVVVERTDPAAKNIWARADSDVELVDADISAAWTRGCRFRRFPSSRYCERKTAGLPGVRRACVADLPLRETCWRRFAGRMNAGRGSVKRLA